MPVCIVTAPIHSLSEAMNSVSFFPGLSLCCVLASSLSGCAGLKNTEAEHLDSVAPRHEVSEPAQPAAMEFSARALELVAADFTHALGQIPSMSPRQGSIQFLSSMRRDRFTAAVKHKMESTGYQVRWVIDNEDDRLFQYRLVNEIADEAGQRTRFEVAVGAVELRRTYLQSPHGVVLPATPLYVRGADASKVALDDARFTKPVEEKPASVSALSVSPEANPLGNLVSDALAAKKVTMPLTALPQVQNVFELGVSNYRNALSEHREVAEQVLTFANDSLRLGSYNKQLISRFLERFDPVSDVISVIGCSQGPTQVKGGNAALALGRASRVREALLFAGVNPEKILDEGCWAGDSGLNTLPARGVVITLNRKI